MKALFITQHNPFGTKGGGVMASHAYLRAVSGCFDGNVDLICADLIKSFEDNQDDQIKLNQVIYAPDRTKAEKMLSVFNGHLNRYIEFAKKYLNEHKGVYDYVFFDQNGISGPLVSMANKLGLITVTIHHNLEQEYYRDKTHGLKRMVFLPHVIRWEKKAYRESRINLFLTGHDLDAFGRLYGNTNATNHVIGIFEFHDYIAPVPKPENQNTNLTFAITGSLVNYQTTDGVSYFFNELYQYLPTDCTIILAGRNPSEVVKKLCSEHSNVNLIPNPDNMDEVIRMADVYICPTKIGGGLKLRVMDGVRNGLPVIVHYRSARGYDNFFDQPIFKVFSNNMEFKNNLQEIIDIVKSKAFSSTKIQEIYKNTFSYEAGLKRMKNCLEMV